MKLTKVEIKGFKSFADKTELEFPTGITAIVGPNGSGKSNIIEAIRWAMGEQSAKSLRGTKMNDVIFAGTASRKPVNFAEVTLSFDNTDHYLPTTHKHVQVTRRLHRNGDSEYFINQQPCRLKDLVDLFTDSGFGKESFSIISQGEVEEVFNSKPEERRAIFEEAAGVLKYKQKKEKAKLKLIRTQENLERIQDIKLELERQLAPLDAQREKALAYKKLHEEVFHLDLSVIVTEVASKKEEWERTKRRLIELQDAQFSRQEALALLEQQFTESKDTLKRLDDQQQATYAQLLDIVKREEQLLGEQKVLLERNKYKDEDQERIQREKLDLLAKQEALQKKYEANKVELTELTQKIILTEQKLSDTEKTLIRLNEHTQETIEELRRIYVQKMQKQTSLAQTETYLDKQIQEIEKQLTHTTKRLEESVEKSRGVSAEHLNVTRTYEDLQHTTKALLNEYSVLYEEKEFESARLQEQKTEFEQLKAEHQSLVFKKETLEEWRTSFSGYYSGVRAVLQETRLKGILGVVADELDVASEYALAIETAIGSAGQFVIVEHEDDAKKAIQYLKEKKIGRATFLPLTTIRPRHMPKAVLSKLTEIEGFLGTAASLVGYHPKIAPAISNILGHILVARDVHAGSLIANVVQYKYRVVTLEGDVFHAGGSLTGGARKKNQDTSLISTKNKIDELHMKITQIDPLEKEKARLIAVTQKKITDIEKHLEELRAKGENARVELSTSHMQVTAKLEELNRLKNEQALYKTEQETRIKEKNTLLLQKKETVATKETVQEELEELKKKLATGVTENATPDREKNRVETILERIKVDLMMLRNESIRIQEQLKNQVDQLGVYAKHIQQIDHHQKRIQHAHVDLEEAELNQQLARLKEAKSTVEQEEIDLRQIKSNQEEKSQNLQQKIEEMERRLIALQKEESQLTILQTKNEAHLDHSLERLTQEYELTFEAAQAQANAEVDLLVDVQRVKDLKRSLAQLGPVNLDAIQEHQEVEERYQFLVDQQEDLVTAKDQLYLSMSDMDKKATELFEKTFTAIQQSFSEIFPRMFGGGKASLFLSDPEHVLTSGIEISAQPPGKRLQHLGLLSGGEKSLTAIALLFAIIQVRPVPFCILDEAEAALDETNIVRFGEFLQSFNGQPQFIVITHRKGTMEKADTLYGVTMQEKGISKLISVQLTQVEDTVSSS